MAKKQEVSLTTLTTEQSIIKSEILVKLVEAGFNQLAIEKSTLIYNADNLDNIKSFLVKVKKVKDVLPQVHKDGKAPHKEKADNWDILNRAYSAELAELENYPNQQLQKIAAEEEMKAKIEATKKKALDDAKQKINAKIMSFSDRIISSINYKELHIIESEINGLKGSAKKIGGEANEILIEKLTELNKLLSSQKNSFKEAGIIEEQLELAKEEGNEELIETLENKKEQIKEQIKENVQVVSNESINIITSFTPTITSTETVYNTRKPTRQVWESEVPEDISKVSSDFKKIVPNDDNIWSYIKDNRSAWDKEGKEEVFFGGIRFYKKKTY